MCSRTGWGSNIRPMRLEGWRFFSAPLTRILLFFQKFRGAKCSPSRGKWARSIHRPSRQHALPNNVRLVQPGLLVVLLDDKHASGVWLILINVITDKKDGIHFHGKEKIMDLASSASVKWSGRNGLEPKNNKKRFVIWVITSVLTIKWYKSGVIILAMVAECRSRIRRLWATAFWEDYTVLQLKWNSYQLLISFINLISTSSSSSSSSNPQVSTAGNSPVWLSISLVYLYSSLLFLLQIKIKPIDKNIIPSISIDKMARWKGENALQATCFDWEAAPVITQCLEKGD